MCVLYRLCQSHPCPHSQVRIHLLKGRQGGAHSQHYSDGRSDVTHNLELLSPSCALADYSMLPPGMNTALGKVGIVSKIRILSIQVLFFIISWCDIFFSVSSGHDLGHCLS